MFGGFFLQGQMSGKHQITHSLDVGHRDVERSCLNVSQKNHDGQRVHIRGGGAKVLGKMRFTNPTFQCPCIRNLSGNLMRYSIGPSSGNVCRLALLGSTMYKLSAITFF